MASRGVLVQPMAEPGVELIVGARRDPQFGPVVVVGLGGILAEAIDDVAVRLAPVTKSEALQMLGELRGARILDGPAEPADGQPPGGRGRDRRARQGDARNPTWLRSTSTR